jgi:transcription elongation GreA/GreB family factor
MSIKDKLLEACKQQLDLRLLRMQKVIKDIENGLYTETKSTAGDKHETGRAMLQLEREKVGNQLYDIEKQRSLVQRIDLKRSHEQVALGSLVMTENANYFIALSLGALTIEGKKIYVISIESPMGRTLMGKTTGELVQFRDRTIKIIKIL